MKQSVDRWCGLVNEIVRVLMYGKIDAVPLDTVVPDASLEWIEKLDIEQRTRLHCAATVKRMLGDNQI